MTTFQKIFFLIYLCVKRYVLVFKSNGRWHHCTLISAEPVFTLCESLVFEWGMIVGARWMGHSISKIVVTCDISQSMISCVYWEYLMEDITIHCGVHHGQPHSLNEWSVCLELSVVNDKWHCLKSHPHSMKLVPDMHLAHQFSII